MLGSGNVQISSAVSDLKQDFNGYPIHMTNCKTVRHKKEQAAKSCQAQKNFTSLKTNWSEQFDDVIFPSLAYHIDCNSQKTAFDDCQSGSLECGNICQSGEALPHLAEKYLESFITWVPNSIW